MKVREVAEVLAGLDEGTVTSLVAAAKAIRSANSALDGLEPKKRRGRRKGSKNAPAAVEPATPAKKPVKAAAKKASKKKEDEEQY